LILDTLSVRGSVLTVRILETKVIFDLVGFKVLFANVAGCTLSLYPLDDTMIIQVTGWKWWADQIG